MKDFLIMEQEEFEDAIKKYTERVTIGTDNKNNEIIIHKFIKRQTYNLIDVRTHTEIEPTSSVEFKTRKGNPMRVFNEPTNPVTYRRGKKARGCITPDGSFESIKDAARFYNINPSTMLGRVDSKVKHKEAGWSFINHV